MVDGDAEKKKKNQAAEEAKRTVVAASIINSPGIAKGRDGAYRSHVILSPSQEYARRYRTEIAASASSLLSTFVAFPLDSVKTRMQAYKFRSFWDCVTQTKRMEGIGGFWRGSMMPLISVTAVRTISFSLYSKSKLLYASTFQKAFGDRYISMPDQPVKPFNPMYWFLSGATSGAFITFIACPFEFTKLSAQIEILIQRSKRSSLDDPSHFPKHVPKGTIATAKEIVKNRGFLGLYSGWRLHLLRDSMGTAMYFTFYESGKNLFAGKEGAGPVAIAASGGLCGLLSWCLIYPVDSAKSIFQRNVLTHVAGQPGPIRPKIRFTRRMYRGISVSVTRSAILNAVFFSSYEAIKREVNIFTGAPPLEATNVEFA